MRQGPLFLLALLLVTATIPLPVAASPTDEASTIDGEAAANWMTGARWDRSGLFTELPSQVVYPHDTQRILETLDDFGAIDRVDADQPAWSIARLQQPSGGFDRFQGDLLGPWTGASALALVFANGSGAEIDEEAVLAFIDARQNDDGGFAPRAGIRGGNLRTVMETTHVVTTNLAQVGELNETTRSEVVAFLRASQNDDGGWPTSMYNPEQSTMTGTWFAVRTLLALGALEDQTQQAAVDYVLSLESPTGGFAASNETLRCGTIQCGDIGTEITTYSTSRAIQLLDRLDALDETGIALYEHADWLSARQIDEGHFAGAFRSYQSSPLPTESPERPVQPSFWEPFEPPVTHFSLTTSLALGALDSLDALDRADADTAIDYLVSLQHPGTGGFGWWPGFVGSLPDTGHATRALDTLDRLDLAHGDALADTLASRQQDNGGITEIEWDYEPRMDHTAYALLALERVGRTDAVDVEAAASFIADHQTEEGGFRTTSSQYNDPTIKATDLALRALSAVDQLHRADRSAAVAFLASHETEEGAISERSAQDVASVVETARALDALAILDSLDAVDTQAAGDHLARWQHEDGSYRNAWIAAVAVDGMATLGRLTDLDTIAVAEQIASVQTDGGATVPAVFFREETAIQQHADILAAAETLGTIEADGACHQRPASGADPGALELNTPTSSIALIRGNASTIPATVAHHGYLRQTVDVTLQQAPEGVHLDDPGPIDLAPTQTATPELQVRANWTATTGPATLVLCVQDAGGGHDRLEVPVDVEAPPEEEISLQFDDDRVDVQPGSTNQTQLTVANDGTEPADLRLEVLRAPGLDVAFETSELRLAAGDNRTLTTDLTVPATCSPKDTVDLQLRAYGPGGGSKTTNLTVNVTERPAERLGLTIPQTSEASLDTSTPIPVTVENQGDAYACVDAETFDVPDPLEAHVEPDHLLVPVNETADAALVVETPEDLEEAKHELGVRLSGQADGADVVERRTTVTISDLPAPSLLLPEPREIATGVRTSTALVGEPIRLLADAQDEDGEVARVEIYPLGLDGPSIEANRSGAEHFVETTYEQTGSHEVAVVAVDDDGQRTVASTGIDVVENRPPTVVLPDRHLEATTTAGALVLLGASADDPEDRPLRSSSYRWLIPTAFGTDERSGRAVHAEFPVGEHVVDLAVEDANGAQRTAQATVTVDDALLLDARFLGPSNPGTADRPTISVLAQRDDGAPVPSPVWINVTHVPSAETVSSQRAWIDGTLSHVQLPYDVEAGPGGFNLAGEHVVTIETQADSRPAAPQADLETAATELRYRVGAW